MKGEPLTDFYEAYLDACKALDALGWWLNIRRDSLDALRNENAGAHQTVHLALTEIRGVLFDISSRTRWLDVPALCKLQVIDIPTPSLLALIDGIDKALASSVLYTRTAAYASLFDPDLGSLRSLRFYQTNRAKLTLLCRSLRDMCKIPTRDGLFDTQSVVNAAKMPNRSQNIVLPSGDRVALKIVMGRREGNAQRILNDLVETKRTLRQATELIAPNSPLSQKIVALTTAAFSNPLMQVYLGPDFRVTCTITISSDAVGAAAWVQNLIRNKLFGRRNVAITLTPDRKDIQVFMDYKWIQNSGISDLASMLLHEVTHVDDNGSLSESMPDTVRREGIAVFAQAIRDPRVVREYLSSFEGKYITIPNLKGKEEYLAGFLLMLDLLQLKLRKRRIGIVNMKEYSESLSTPEAVIWLRTALRLTTIQFFAYYEQKLGSPPYLSKELWEELAKESRSVTTSAR